MEAEPIFKAVGTLILSFVVIIGIYLLIRKYAGKMNSVKAGSDNMEILAKMSLPPKSYLYVVRAGNKKLLLGVTEKSIATLAELDNENTVISENENVPETFANVDIQNIVPKVDNKQYEKELGFSSFVKSIFNKN
jgi:flagellar biosynthetic protein FliO